MLSPLSNQILAGVTGTLRSHFARKKIGLPRTSKKCPNVLVLAIRHEFYYKCPRFRILENITTSKLFTMTGQTGLFDCLNTKFG